MADSTTKKPDTEPKAAEQKPADAKTDPRPAEHKPAGGKANLAPAGQSGDPDVQRLLAIRQGHADNAGLVEDPEAEVRRDAARKAIADIDEQLEALGYTAG